MNIDYPEYDDVEEATTKFLLKESRHIENEIDQLLKQASKVKLCVKVYQQSLLGNRT